MKGAEGKVTHKEPGRAEKRNSFQKAKLIPIFIFKMVDPRRSHRSDSAVKEWKMK
jgi:hypothetical protein